MADAWPEPDRESASDVSATAALATTRPPRWPTSGSRSRPRIGLVGFFGHGNYGDELFLDVFEQFWGRDFDLVEIVDRVDAPYYSRPVDELVDDVDAIVIGGGDLVRPWGLDERWFNPAYLRKPVYMVGLGVAVRPHVVEKEFILNRYARFFQHENVRFVGVRDDASRRWVESRLSPNVPVRSAPDIVCALDLPPVERQPNLLGVVTRLRPNREVPDDYSAIQKLATELISRGWGVRHIVAGTAVVGKRDFANASDLDVPDKEVVYSEDLDEITRAIGECSALVSMKFHGTVAATMYGIPSMVLIPTSKNVNFMRRIDRRDLVSHFEADDLLDHFQPIPPGHDAETLAMLRDQATDLMSELTSLIRADVTPASASVSTDPA